ncbi:damage-control phosphatase ARMT1 family protein [Acetobacterium bakii]|uniref:Damage-control phosphatase ARMT1-like metal-binding domain-containing protein n=1 Tax=Acetobacterium bakii TaxID=52689 RepID=A0A0L6TWY1_9FIRM|nr:ARMT1-like domain-containing protein [Acetobacterium bakii]KNZ40758.1 hypothetical protein AKG39_15760 [Acetobacterium bakii]
MKIFLDCLPCMLRQVNEAAGMATENEAIHQKIMDEAIATLSKYRDYSCVPEMCGAMHRIVKVHSGIDDPYGEIKNHDISESLKLEPTIRHFASQDLDLLLGVLKVSATGNIMDSGVYNNLEIESCLKEEVEKPFAICELDLFKKDLQNAKLILMIGDNAGEVVFDKLLAEYLARNYHVIYAVRGAAIINDAVMEDALKTGINDYAQIISMGCDTPGAVLDLCSQVFIDIFNQADIVISKGQGNFEALSDQQREIYFLLKAKCHHIAKTLDVEVNDYVFKKSIGKYK